MLTDRHLSYRAKRILIAAFVASLAMQTAIIAGASLRERSSFEGFSSLLLSDHHRFSDALRIAAMNSAWLVAITLLAWPIARLWSWDIHSTLDHPLVNVFARFAYPAVAVALVGTLWWIFSEQALILSEHLVSRWALLATLPHGTLELTALFLPLSSAATCIFKPAERPGRLILKTFCVALPLVAIAALTEVYVGAELVSSFRA